MMKKLLLTAGLMLGITLGAMGATNAPSLYNAKEFSATLSSGYVLDGADPFGADYTANVTAGVAYFPTKILGLEANVPFYKSQGVSFSEAQAGLLARYPIWRFAPYVGLGGAYNWNEPVDVSYIAKGGLEFRFNPKWGIFTEYQYRNNSTSWEKGASSLHGGLRLVF